ncbi:hypothetical protein IKF81_02290 [Candidatus Saccharibacteria bacterium]|nr:hypothetical protein [Candidatus Saccharibacteria bacterium]
MNILITNPEVDPLTRYLLVWSESLINKLEKSNTVYHLKQERVSRKEFEGFIKKKDIDLVLLNGHGAEDRVEGNNETILDNKNVSLLKGKAIHSLTCSSAKKLGKKAVEKGAKSFVGYKEPFVTPNMDDKVRKPQEDTTAKLFLDPAFIVQEKLAIGKTPTEAVEAGRAAYARSIIKAMTSPIQSDDDQFIPCLLWNMRNLVAIE